MESDFSSSAACAPELLTSNAPKSTETEAPGVSKHNSFLAGNSIEDSLKMIEIAWRQPFVSGQFRHSYEDFEIYPTSDRQFYTKNLSRAAGNLRPPDAEVTQYGKSRIQVFIKNSG